MRIEGCPALNRVVVAVKVSNKPVLGIGIVINAVADSFSPNRVAIKYARFACGNVIRVVLGELNAKATVGLSGREFGNFAEVGRGFFAPAQKSA